MLCLTLITIVCDLKKKSEKIPTDIAVGCNHYLTVTLGSWVTPQVITALVPLMTLWSCGGLVMRVRAVNTHRGCYSETVWTADWTELTGLVSYFTQCLFETEWITQCLRWVEYFARLSRTGNVNLCTENEYIHESLHYSQNILTMASRNQVLRASSSKS